MGQIKNIKLHIVTDIKCKLDIILKDHSLSLQSKMQFPLNMMHDSIWVDRLNYIEAEEFIHLSKSGQDQVSNISSSLVSEISNMRENIKTCVSGITSSTVDGAHVAKLEAENKSLKKLIDDLSKQVNDLTLRVGKLEGAPAPAPAPTKKDDDEDEDDFELFGSDEEEEEETEEEKAKKAELLKKYHEKKAKKPALIAKSNIVLDVKPWDDETDLVEVEKMVRAIEMDLCGEIPSWFPWHLESRSCKFLVWWKMRRLEVIFWTKRFVSSRSTCKVLILRLSTRSRACLGFA